MAELSPFRLDPFNQCLWRRTGSGGEQRILLTPTEFGVLDHLLEHAGRLVTHRELLDAVWPGMAIEPQVVKNKVFHLRRVLEDRAEAASVHRDAARRGYRFVGRLERSTRAEAEAPTPGSRLVGREAPSLNSGRGCVTPRPGRCRSRSSPGSPASGRRRWRTSSRGGWPPPTPQCASAAGNASKASGARKRSTPCSRRWAGCAVGLTAPAWWITLASEAPTWLVQFPALLTRQHRETLRQEILGATRERMLREICNALAALSMRRPLLLVLEDLHWGDSSTLDLISALARHHTPARIMLIATYRPSEVAGSATAGWAQARSAGAPSGPGNRAAATH